MLGGDQRGLSQHIAALAAWRALPYEEQIRAATGPPAEFRTTATGKVRVGLVCPCLRQGGGEAWNLALIKSTSGALDWVGMVCLDAATNSNEAMVEATAALLPIQFGRGAIADLASKVDVLVSWVVEDLDGPTIPIIWVDHFVHSEPYPAIARHCLRNVARLVCVSELCLPGVPPEWRAKTSIIGNAVDPDRLATRRMRAAMRSHWGVPEGALVAGFYARIALEKRPDAMIRLAANLGEPWHVVLIGEGKPHQSEPMYLARLLGQLPPDITRRIHLLPPDPAAGDVLAAFDVLVNPSQAESFGLTMAEGLHLGTPVVATPTGLAALHPELVYPIDLDGSGEALAAAVREAHERGPKPDSRSFAQVHFSPDLFGDQWAALISTVAGRPLGVPPLATQAKSFAGAMISHAASGFTMASASEADRRREICELCPFLVGANTCGKCGCNLNAKRSLGTSSCPIGKWGVASTHAA